MFERFTDEARHVVVLAQEEARALNHGHIGTEHLLVALCRSRGSVASSVLRDLGLDPRTAREQVNEIVERGSGTPSGHMPFTPRAKKVLEHSLREALQLGHMYIGSQHILLGLLREGRGTAMEVLRRKEISADEVRAAVVSYPSKERRDAADVAPEYVEETEEHPVEPVERSEVQMLLARILNQLARLTAQVEDISRRLPPRDE